jgi:L-alanine-DL-glutamate epimerase-like enolase superfamily enzyme
MHEVTAALYQVPTDRPAAEGTPAGNHTTMLLVGVEGADGARGLGFAYTGPGAESVVRSHLRDAIQELDEDDVGACWTRMVAAVRSAGRPGLAATAVSAVDIALWDLRARRLGLPLFHLLPAYRRAVPIYGSGGFTSYTFDELVEQLGGWVERGIPRVKMKIGLGLKADAERMMAVREAIGPDAELMVDAGGRYSAKEAISLAHQLADTATYLEEPVPSEALEDMALVRRSVPQDVAAGEHGYDPWYFWRLLRSDAVDILQADVTRCLGITGLLMAGNAAYAAQVRFSTHAAPAIHAHAACGVPQLCHVEYFHDHARMEELLFEGVPAPIGGELVPDPGRAGLGLVLRAEADEYRAP